MRGLLVGIAVLLAAACSDPRPLSSQPLPSAAEPARSPVAEVAQPRVCEAERGTANDVAHEPDWRRYGDFDTWTTADGCAVRVDVLTSRPGAQHCNLESATVLITGRPLGTRATTNE